MPQQLPIELYNYLTTKCCENVVFTNTIVGNVWNDENGLTDLEINSTGIEQIPSGMFLVAVNTATNLVVKSTHVNSSDGSFRFVDMTPSTEYRITLTTLNPSVGDSEPSSILPIGWEHVGESPVSGLLSGSDGVPDGRLTVFFDINNLPDVNFGIRRISL